MRDKTDAAATAVATALLLVPAAILVSVLYIVWTGFALSVLWGWFVTPVFGLPPLGLAPAIGLSLIVWFLTSQYIKAKEHDSSGMAEVGRIASCVAALLFGWIVKQFM